jgi:hypothetical protein
MSIELRLTNEQRFLVLSIFDAQSLKIEDYVGGLVWHAVYTSIMDDWMWREIDVAGLSNLRNPYEAITITLSNEHATVLTSQLLFALRSGLTGVYVKGVIDVIEKIRALIPDVVKI